MPFCQKCGEAYKEGEQFCPKCGGATSTQQTPIQVNVQNVQTQGSSSGRAPLVRNHTTAIILAILVGWLGADRFYVGHGGLGILKLLTLGGYGIWWIIDIILFSTKSVSGVEWA